MALEVGQAGAPPAQKLRVQLSEILELNFALFLDRTCEVKAGHTPPDWLQEFGRKHPELRARLLGFWDTPGYYAWDEMLVASQASGTLFDETLDRFWERLPGTLSREIPVPPLPTETPEVPGIVAERLARLRESEELRETYVALLREFWEAIRPRWEKTGRPAAIEFLRSLRVQTSSLDAFRKSLPGVTLLRREDFASTVEAALARDQILVAPLSFAVDGQLVIALEGVLCVGVGLDSGQKVERWREQAEATASRLKVLSDPTRVALVRALLKSPLTITDLANYFELSQPTISVHMKALREAGLVVPDKRGNQTTYRTDEGTLWEYVAGALDKLGVRPPGV